MTTYPSWCLTLILLTQANAQSYLEYIGSSPANWAQADDLKTGGGFMSPGPGATASPAGGSYSLNTGAGGSFTQQVGDSANNYQFYSGYYNDAALFSGEYSASYSYRLSGRYTTLDDAVNSPNVQPEHTQGWELTLNNGDLFAGFFGVQVARSAGTDYLIAGSFGSNGQNSALLAQTPAGSGYAIDYTVDFIPLSPNLWQIVGSGNFAGNSFSVNNTLITPTALGTYTEMWARLDTGGDGDGYTNVDHLTWNTIPVPETGTTALAALASLGLLRRRR